MANYYKKINIGGSGGSDDRRLKVTLSDTTAGFLAEKVTTTSTKISTSVTNPAGDAKLDLDVNESAVDHDQLLNFDASEHVPKDDLLTTTDNLWSAQKTQDELDLKADITYVDTQDAATLASANSYTDTEVATRVAKAGDTMTGDLILQGSELIVQDTPTSTYSVIDSGQLYAFTFDDNQGVTITPTRIDLGKYDGVFQPYFEMNLNTGRFSIQDQTTGEPIPPVSDIDIPAKKYVDDGDAATLSSANSYTDAGLATKADLVGGKVPSNQLPALVITEVFVVADIAARDALVIGSNDGEVQQGDFAIVLSNANGDREPFIYDGTQWQTVDTQNFNTLFGLKTTDDLTEGTSLYFTAKRAQDAVGNILTDSSTIDFTYDDILSTITASVIDSAVNHDSLLNFDANEHIDHTTVSISAGEGLTGGGDISANRTISLDVTGLTSTTVDGADELVVYDVTALAHRKILVSDIASIGSSAGDIAETSFSLAESQIDQPVTGFAFANASVRSFKAQVSVAIDADSDLFEVFDIQGVQKTSGWEISVASDGDDSLIDFNITSLGQVTYSSNSYTGFVSGLINFRASVTSV
jgi:hypothetical protein